MLFIDISYCSQRSAKFYGIVKIRLSNIIILIKYKHTEVWNNMILIFI